MPLHESETETIGIPLAPIMYWNNFHFWYWWGRPSRDPITFTERNWVERGETIITLKDMKITSPFSGQVVSQQSRSYDDIDVSEHYICGPCFEMKIQRGMYTENIGYIYQDVLEYILREVERTGPGTLSGLFNSGFKKIFGDHLDPKKRFDSHEDFLAKARDLLNVRAIKLD